MNTFTKTLSIALSLITLAYLPNAAAADTTSSVSIQTVAETITNTQDTSVTAWPKNGGIQF